MNRPAVISFSVVALSMFGFAASIPQSQIVGVESPAWPPSSMQADREQMEVLKASIANVVTELKSLRGNIPQAEAVTEDIAKLKSGFDDLRGKFVSTAIEPIDTHDDEIADALSRLTNLETKLADLESRCAQHGDLEKRIAALESRSTVTSASYTKASNGSNGGSNGTYATTSYGSNGTTYSTSSYGSTGTSVVVKSYAVPVQSYQPVRNAVRVVAPPRLKLYSPSNRCYVDEYGNRICQ